MTSGNEMVDNQDRENNLTTLEQREVDIKYELADKHKQLKQSQDVISEEQSISERLEKEIEDLENERDTLYDTNEIEE